MGDEAARHTVRDLQQLLDSGERFGTIYADPPWQYDKTVGRAAASKHYDTMTIDEICALPVRELAADDAHLHLWITNGFLEEIPRIFKAWGFDFRSSFVWVKPEIGCGNYWRNAHEMMFSGTRGAAEFKENSDANPEMVREMITQGFLKCSRGQHSGKPEQVRAMIEHMSPGPYLELFGRRSAAGWTVWGNQIETTLFG